MTRKPRILSLPAQPPLMVASVGGGVAGINSSVNFVETKRRNNTFAQSKKTKTMVEKQKSYSLLVLGLRTRLGRDGPTRCATKTITPISPDSLGDNDPKTLIHTTWLIITNSYGFRHCQELGNWNEVTIPCNTMATIVLICSRTTYLSKILSAQGIRGHLPPRCLRIPNSQTAVPCACMNHLDSGAQLIENILHFPGWKFYPANLICCMVCWCIPEDESNGSIYESYSQSHRALS